MNTISIVIITKNEEHVLEKTLRTLKNITDDLIIVDSGSNDQTLSIAKMYGAKILQTEWLGYGATKNFGISHAKYDWILSLDADEGVDDVLKQNILELNLTGNKTVVYKARFKNFIGEVYLKFGSYLKSSSPVLFNKKSIKWDNQLIHEKLVIPNGFTTKNLKGYILHYTMKDIVDYNNKMLRYTILNAQKYFAQGKKITNYKLFVIRGYTFIKNYFIGLGFLDGTLGFTSANIYAYYTFLKYALLKKLINSEKKQ